VIRVQTQHPQKQVKSGCTMTRKRRFSFPSCARAALLLHHDVGVLDESYFAESSWHEIMNGIFAMSLVASPFDPSQWAAYFTNYSIS
jgi:hypothetical protein